MMRGMITSQVSLRTFATVLCAAFVLQVALLMFVVPAIAERFSPSYSIGFSDDYDVLALNIAEGHGYRFFPETSPTVMREPGYPLVLSAVFSVFGHSLPAARFVNLLLAFAGALIVAALASRVSERRAVVLGAPLLFLFQPGTLVAESRGGFEILFVFALLVFMLTLMRALEDGRHGRYLAAGVALGCVLLIRSTLLIFPLFVLGYLWLRNRNVSSLLADGARVAVMMAAMLAVLSPWIVRNYVLTGRFVPATSVLGVSAHAGQSICKRLTFDNELQDLDTEAARERGRLASALGYVYRAGYYQYFFNVADEIGFSNYLLKHVLAEYAANPALAVRCVSLNAFNFWFAGKTWRVTAVNVVVQLPFMILALCGVWFGIRNGQSASIAPMALLMAYLMCLHAPILAQARYSVPLIPFVSLLACYGLTCAVSLSQPRRITLSAGVRGHDIESSLSLRRH
jgi:4-amino-4-deoxy-L-arabinose transferase-like glycosyltransferase